MSKSSAMAKHLILSHETRRNIFQTDQDAFDLSPKLYDWGYDGKCAGFLAGAILFAVTDDAKLSLEYYPLFKVDHVSRWGNTGRYPSTRCASGCAR